MPRILVQPEHLQALSRQWAHIASDLQALACRLTAAMNDPDWDTRQQALIEELWGSARRQVNALTDQAEGLARYLAAKAQAFEEADHNSAAALGQVMGAFAMAGRAWHAWYQPLALAQSFPQNRIEQLLAVGGSPAVLPAVFITRLAGLPESHRTEIRPVQPASAQWQERLEMVVAQINLSAAHRTISQ